MKFTEELPNGSNVIHAYHEHGININGQTYSESLVLSQEILVTDWPVSSIAELNRVHLQDLLSNGPEVILIGTGKQLVFPSPDIYAPIISQGIGIEFMDTGAACRTYNILISENRKVIAGMIL